MSSNTALIAMHNNSENAHNGLRLLLCNNLNVEAATAATVRATMQVLLPLQTNAT
jgi:hypothetical protein